MAEGYKSYRIRTKVGQDAPNVVNVHLDQTYDEFQILSLKIDQVNSYNLYQSDKGVVVGRVLANGGFGVPNAKVSIFIPTDDTMGLKKHILYPYSSVNDANNDRVRYNLLPDYVDEACHQNVGTFPNKRLVLDNDDIIEIFDKFWKYTTVTNQAGDYMLSCVPVGNQTLHMDVDLSDIGLLSQRPRDMVYKGYNINQFESPNKFKQDTNLNSLAQIKSQDIGVYVYPFWGDTTDNGDNIAVTRCDIQVDYKFEPTCIFIGSIITDTGSNAIGKNCAGTDNVGKMSDLVAGEGSIEMIRKTLDNKVEEFQIKGNRVIDGDGVWCYQIPMNLDYVTTDEFGNMVPTDNPDKGIPTRTRVRFRISLDDAPSDNTARKRCKYLVPNNPRIDAERFPVFTADEAHEPDYEFGTNTREESYCDLFWNKVYSVKNYIPRIQKNTKITNRKHTGIKLINHYGDNNPMPYNNLSIKLSFTYRFICVLTKIFIKLVGFLNNIITILGALPCKLAEFFRSIANLFNKMRIRIRAFGKTLINICLGCPIGALFEGVAKIFDLLTPPCIAISSEFCSGDVTHAYTFYPGCGFNGLARVIGRYLAECVWKKTYQQHLDDMKDVEPEDRTTPMNRDTELYNCVESQLAEDNDATSFNFQNDWINGTLYSPLWFRKITPKRSFLFGLFKRRAKDEWCSADHVYNGLVRIFHPCAVNRTGSGDKYENFIGEEVKPQYMQNESCGDSCHEKKTVIGLNTGLIRTKETMLGQTVYYYKPIEWDSTNHDLSKDGDKNGRVKLLFATDIILLGSLNDCDLNGVPQFFKSLESTTYKLPSNMLFTDNNVTLSFSEDGSIVTGVDQVSTSEMTGNDWGNTNDDICGEPDGGLFYGIGCSTIEMMPKSCINLSRICEFGVSLDEAKEIANIDPLQSSKLKNGDEDAYMTLVPDGFISKDELYNDDERSMFATMNGNELSTRLNVENGLKEYDFRHLYVNNFDNSLKNIMQNRQSKCQEYTYSLNYQLEDFSRGYYDFRMGKKPFFYDGVGSTSQQFTMPRYENSFYFYFGLKVGKTAIDKFNSQFFAECYNPEEAVSPIGVYAQANTWCSNINWKVDADGFLKLDLSNISLPCDILIQDKTDLSEDGEYQIKNNKEEKIIIDDSDSDDGYVKTAVTASDGSTVWHIKNGDYRIIITDADDEIYQIDISMVMPYLRYDTYETSFNTSENVLLRQYTNYNGISRADFVVKCTTDTTWPDEECSRSIGGTIMIHNIVDGRNGEPITTFKITIESVDAIESFTGNNGKFKFEYPSDSSYLISSGSKDSDNFYLFAVPKGDERYKIVIEEMCGTTPSGNRYTKTVFVGNPIPYKLYINSDIDYDVIYDWGSGFKLGSISGNKVDISDFSRGDFSNKWLNISNLKNYHWEKAIPYQNSIDKINKAIKRINSSGVTSFSILDINTFYSDDDFKNLIEEVRPFIENDLISGECETIKTECENVNTYRSNFISSMKTTFWLTCPAEEKDFTFTATTSDMPVTFNIAYRTEKALENENRNTLENNDNKKLSYFADNYHMEGNMIPSITTSDSEYYGGGTIIDGKISTGQDKESKYSNKNKYALFVSVINSAKLTLPDGVTEANKTDSYFGFHIIDKILNINYVAWAYINNIPCYKPTSSINIGKTIELNGLFAGKIFNGNTVSGKFVTSKVGQYNMELYTTDDEDAMPTERYIVYDTDGNTNSLRNISRYIIETAHPWTTNTDKLYREYLPLLPTTVNMELEDNSNCQLVEEIYGGMQIVLNEESVNNCRDKKSSIFNLSIEDGPSNGVTYYAYKFNNDYPLNYVNATNMSLDYELRDLNFKDNRKYLFSFNTKNDDLRNSVVKNELYSKNVDEYGTESETFNNGYGQNGVFETNGRELKGEYFIIARTDNECRAISPVYAYVDVYGSVVIGKVHTKTEDSGSGGGGDEPIEPEVEGETTPVDEEEDGGDTTPTTTFKTIDNNVVGFYIVNATDVYYFNNFEYKMSISCEIDPVHVISDEAIVSAANGSNEMNALFIAIDDDMYDIVHSFYKNLITKRSLASITTIKAVDETTLTHIACISTSDDDMYEDEWNAVTFRPNGGYWSKETDPTNTSDTSSKTKFISAKKYQGDTYDICDDFFGKPKHTDVDTQFRGWYEIENENTIYECGDKISVSEPLIFVAKWASPITITWDASASDGGYWEKPSVLPSNIISDSVVYDGDKITKFTSKYAADEITSDGFICPLGEPLNSNEDNPFNTWTCIDNCDEVTIGENNEVVTEVECAVKATYDTKFTVRWMDSEDEDETVNITFKVSANNGKWYPDDSVSDYTMAVSKNSTVTCDRIAISTQPLIYGFAGWNANSSATSGSSTVEVGDTDITVYAIFRTKECQIAIKDVSTGTDNITLEVESQSGAGGTHYEYTGFTGECHQNMSGGSGILECNGITDSSIIRLYIADDIFYKLNGNNYFADLYKNRSWHIDEYSEKLQEYNICYTVE